MNKSGRGLLKIYVCICLLLGWALPVDVRGQLSVVNYFVLPRYNRVSLVSAMLHILP